MKINTVVIDTETLDVSETAIVLTLSAIRFNRFGEMHPEHGFVCHPDDEFHIAIDVTEQLLQGRTTSPSTLKWWNEQSEEAKAALWTDSLNTMRVKDALKELTAFIGDCQPFARGTDFDFKILGHLYRTNDMKAPWKFNQVRDVRTYIDAFTGDTAGYIKNFEAPSWMVTHNSLHDCYRDAMQMVQARAVVMGLVDMAKQLETIKAEDKAKEMMPPGDE
ncbi:3'-5' exoribonuclease [Parasalinivibrio latis]|uniref:3'-5' exonuclease n=1 Tax=Parasalinivibrio latis TaxID=2952610 RepID=UPI0030E18073